MRRVSKASSRAKSRRDHSPQQGPAYLKLHVRHIYVVCSKAKTLTNIIGAVIVRFYDFRNESRPAEEVLVMEERGLIQREWVNGKMCDCVKLSSLLPKAIEQSTPIKSEHPYSIDNEQRTHHSQYTGRGGRIYRGGISTSGSRVSWATVESILSGNLSQQALMRIVNVYPLVALENEEGCFVCDVYLDADMNVSLYVHSR